MEKYIIHTLNINKKLEKNNFQILLPENAAAICGIAVTCDQYVISKIGLVNIQRQAGTIALFASDSGEEIFSENLRASFPFSKWQIFDGVGFDRNSWVNKKQFTMLDTNQKTECTLIDGFYQDDVGKILDSVNYNVRIYLRIKCTEK